MDSGLQKEIIVKRFKRVNKDNNKNKGTVYNITSILVFILKVNLAIINRYMEIYGYNRIYTILET